MWLLMGYFPQSYQSGCYGCWVYIRSLRKKEQLRILSECGFKDIQIKKEKSIFVPDEIMLKFITKEELQKF
jgi:hypothetical protein